MADVCDLVELLCKGAGTCCQVFLRAGSWMCPSQDCCCCCDKPHGGAHRNAQHSENVFKSQVSPQSMHIDRLLLHKGMT